MHPQDNNTPPALPPPNPRLITEALALEKEHKGLDDLSASARATKAATYKRQSSCEGISSAGTILKNEGT